MRLLRPRSVRALLCLVTTASAAGALGQGKRQQSSSVASTLTSPTSTQSGQSSTVSTATGATTTASATATPKTRTTASSPTRANTVVTNPFTTLIQSTLPPTLTTSSLHPSHTHNATTSIFNATLPEGQLPLEPQITPAWAVAGTLLLVTGVIHALFGIRAQRVHTFFSAAFLASLGTTVLILYLMTPPASNAVQGAFVVAAVCTGAALGGLAVLFNDLAECLGCLLGGFCLSMWLLTLHAGGLVPGASGKVVFIAVFGFGAFCLYFSRWTRAYGLIGCISLSGATAAVLGIDCFSRAGLKEFWAYIWDLNDKLFPDGAVTYPLTRGIRVELAVTILFFAAGVVSQLKLWRLIQDRRDHYQRKMGAPGGGGSGDEEAAVLPEDEEETVGRQVEEMTNRERREWERMYGDASSLPPAPEPSTTVGDVESEKREDESKRTFATSTTEVPSAELPLLDGGEMAAGGGEASEKVPVELAGLAHDAEKATIMVRVAEESVPEDEEGGGPFGDVERADEVPENVVSMPAGRGVRASEPPIVPLPFRIPTPKIEQDRRSVAASVDDKDRVSVAAIADEVEVAGPMQEIQPEAGAPTSSAQVRGSVAQRPVETRLEKGMAGERYEALTQPVKGMPGDRDSVVATLDDESNSGDADTAVLDWAPPQPEGAAGGVVDLAEKKEVAEALPQQTPAPGTPAAESPHERVEFAMLGERHGPRIVVPRPPTPIAFVAEVKNPMQELKHALATGRQGGAPLHDAREPSDKGTESNESFRTMVARLTKLNLPPALPEVALTYRTNEWVKHLSAAETPDPDILLLPGPVMDAPDEEPAHLDIIELQQTAENGAPPPAAPRSTSALSNYRHHAASGSMTRTSLTGSEPGFGPPGPDTQGYKPGHFRATSAMLKHQNSAVLAEPIVEEDGDRADAMRALSGSAHHRLASSMSSPNLALQAPTPRSHTLISMREMLLRSRASGIFSYFNNDTTGHLPTDAPGARRAISDAGSLRGEDLSGLRSLPDIDLDDLPLSQRRVIMRHSSLPLAAAGPQLPVPLPTATAESTAFDSHQPARHSGVPSESVRQIQLANFRNSVAADLHAGSPSAVVAPAPVYHPSVTASGARRLGSDLVGLPAAAALSSSASGSMPSLPSPTGAGPGFGFGGGFGPTAMGMGANTTTMPTPLTSPSPPITITSIPPPPPPPIAIPLPIFPNQHPNQTTTIPIPGPIPNPNLNPNPSNPNAGALPQESRGDVLRNIELQRSILLGQKEAEAARRGAERAERQRHQRHQREFEERMRSGALMGAHRDAMRRLQGGVKG